MARDEDRNESASPARGGRRPGSGRRADPASPWELRAVQALADPSRWTIVQQLSKREASVGELAREIGVSAANMSHHISILIDAELVQTRRAGRQVVARLAGAPGRAAALLRSLGIEPTSNLLSGRPAGAGATDAMPELEHRPMTHRVRYPSKDMDDFLL